MSDSKRNGRAQLLFEQISKLAKLAKTSTFIMRKRKLTAEVFLLCLFKSIFNGKASFHQMASRIGRIEKTSISKQALWKRIDRRAITLLTDIKLGKTKDDELLRHCELNVEFSSADEDRPAPYWGKISISGTFRIADTYAEIRRDQLIEVTATSIPYGACRGM